MIMRMIMDHVSIRRLSAAATSASTWPAMTS
jgi:hypothetical protein